MKRALIWLLALIMLMQCIAVFAEGEETAEAEEVPQIVYNYDELTVGTITPFEGKFFTQLWGNDTSDLDVRLLLHGYNTVYWDNELGLFTVDPSVVSGLLTEENPEGDRRYTLALYEDLYYSDGTQITAWDYAFSILLNMSPVISELGGTPRPLEYLYGYEEYITGQAQALAGVRVINDYVLEITVSGEYLPYFYELTLLSFEPYPISVIAPGCAVYDDGEGVYIANADAEEEEPLFTAELLAETILDEESGYRTHPSVTSGPYKLISFDGDQAVFEINEYYKGNSEGIKPSIAKLIYKEVNTETMMDELANGEYGLINRCVSADAIQGGIGVINENDLFTMTAYLRVGLSFVSFCTEKTPMDSLEVRKAIAMCMDKDTLVTDTTGDNGLRADGYYGLGQWMYMAVNDNMEYPLPEPEAGAPAEEKKAYEEAVAAWDELTLENVTVYELDVEGAIELLEEDGWTLGPDGESYDADAGTARCKEINGEIVPLELKMLRPAGSALNEALDNDFIENLKEAGILVTVDEKPMQELLSYYYRMQERDYDMIALATNFDIVFEPSVHFLPDDGENINHYNTTAIADDTLYKALVDMSMTEPNDAVTYAQKWIAFQEEFQEEVPMIPLYSNVYFDFYPRVLHDYEVGSNVSWAKAIVAAYLGDAEDLVEEPLEDDEVIFED